MADAIDAPSSQTIYWHRDLPPMKAEPMGEHVVEATSTAVQAPLAHRDELWGRCYQELMTHAQQRLRQEVLRLGGDYAHVLDEAVDSQHNDVANESWLHGRFTYMLYARGKRAARV